MKLNSLNEDEYRILQTLVREFYVALPENLKTYSLFSTHLLSKALQHYRIKTRVIPCRLWCSTLKPEKEFVGGVLNFGDAEKWNGHAICLAGDWLIDASIYHLNPTFGYQVPKIIAKRIIFPEPLIYARHKLDKNKEFIWYRLPAKAPAIPMVGYEDFMQRYFPTLLAHMDSVLFARAQKISPAQITLAQAPVDDTAELALENMANGESDGLTENVLSEATEALDTGVLEGDSAELQSDTETTEERAIAEVD
jgi:hypothetical protein